MLRCTVGPPRVKRSSGAIGLSRSHFEFDLHFLTSNPNPNPSSPASSHVQSTTPPTADSPLPTDQSHQKSWVVAKRYTDFLKLCADLRRFYPDLAIPELPPKVLWFVRCNVDDLLEERRNGLQAIVDACIAAEDLRESNFLLDFIQAPDRNVLRKPLAIVEQVKILDEICKLETELDQEMQRDVAKEMRMFGLMSTEIDFAIKMMIIAIITALCCLAPTAEHLVTHSPKTPIAMEDSQSNRVIRRQEFGDGRSRMDSSFVNGSMGSAGGIEGACSDLDTALEANDSVGDDALICMLGSVDASGFELELGGDSVGFAMKMDEIGLTVEDGVSRNCSDDVGDSSEEKGTDGWDAPLTLTVLACAAWYLLEYHTIPKQMTPESERHGSNAPPQQNVEREPVQNHPKAETQPSTGIPEEEEEENEGIVEVLHEVAAPLVVDGVEGSACDKERTELVVADRGNKSPLRKRQVTSRAIALLLLSLLAMRSRRVLRLLAAFGKMKAKA